MKDIYSNLKVFPLIFMCIYSKYESTVLDKSKGGLVLNVIQCCRFVHCGHFHSRRGKIVHGCLLCAINNIYYYNDHYCGHLI